MTDRPAPRLADRLRRLTPRHLIYFGALIATAAGLGIFLNSAPLPWDEGVAAREAAGRNVKMAGQHA